MKILMLGGTGFASRVMVRRAIARGHQLTIFNRGSTAPDMFPTLSHVQGDRYGDLSGLKKLVADGNTFDAVIDSFTYVPKTVTDTLDILLPAIDQYVVISTTSVYSNRIEAGMDESGALETISDSIANRINTHKDIGVHYGAMKVRVERAVEERFPSHVCIIRPGLIVGEGDTSGRYTYWPVRASEGGTMVGPGSGDDFIQYIDVRDLADFTIHCVEQNHIGTFNAISPMRLRTTRNMIQSAIHIANSTLEVGTKVEWVETDFLEKNDIHPWKDMPAWIPNSAKGYEGNGQLSTEKSIRAGLKTRPIDDTTWNTLDDFLTEGKELQTEQGEEAYLQWSKKVRGGLDPSKERDVLLKWEKEKRANKTFTRSS